MHLIWTGIYGYFEPVPYRMVISFYISMVCLFVRLWAIIPRQNSEGKKLRKKCKPLLCRYLWNLFINVQLIYGVTTLFVLIEPVAHTFLWLIAIVVPMSKIFNDYVIGSFVIKYASEDNRVHAKAIANILTKLNYSNWYVTHLDWLPKNATYVLFGINFALNMLSSYKIIRLNSKIDTVDYERKSSQSAQKALMTKLILNEFIELMAPLALITAEFLKYDCPNNLSLGSVNACYIFAFGNLRWKMHWNLTAILNRWNSTLKMVLIDLLSAILSGILLWWFCHINVFRKYFQIIKKYWIYLSLWGGVCLSGVSIRFIVANISDFQFRYCSYFLLYEFKI